MGFTEAFNDLVLSPLKVLAHTPDSDTYRIVITTQEIDDDGDPVVGANDDVVYLKDGRKHPFYDRLIRSHTSHGQGCYDSDEEVLWYAYCYMPMHFQVMEKAIRQSSLDAKALRNCITNADRGDLLFIDIGSGPLTAGVAIADWYVQKHGEPLGLSYIGIDPSISCRRLARQFAARDDLFELAHPFRSFASVEKCDIRAVKLRVKSSGTIVILLSYLFGQSDCTTGEVDKLATFVAKVLDQAGAKRAFIVYTNTTYREEALLLKYQHFRDLIGAEDSPSKVSYKPEVHRGFVEEPFTVELAWDDFHYVIEELSLD